MKRLYVGNLQWGVTDRELTEFFSQAGEVEDAAVILDRDTGRSRGFGFVEMATEEGTKKALEFDGKELANRPLVVSEARPEPGGAERPGERYERPEQTEETSGFIQSIKDFVLEDPKVGDELGFSVDGKHFIITHDHRDELSK